MTRTGTQEYSADSRTSVSPTITRRRDVRGRRLQAACAWYAAPHALIATLFMLGCAKNVGPTARSPELEAAIASGDDRSRCDYKGRNDREVIETRGPGASRDNVRRVYSVSMNGEERRRSLVCREVDTNLDGVVDLLRRYDEKGLPSEEEADADYDGRLDTWVKFSAGRVLKVELDGNRDSKPDETRLYVRGKLSRIQRDTNQDGKSDVWEIYGGGQLERIGTDLDYDGLVDRWARDEVAHRLTEQKEREEEERAAREAAQKQADAEKDNKPAEGYVSPRKR